MAFDILSAQLDDTTILHLEHPVTGLMYDGDDDSKPVTIELYGRASKTHRNWVSLQQRKKNSQAGKKEKALSPDEALADTAEFLATLTVSIKNMDMGGKKLDNKEAYKELYSNPKLDWITQQVVEKLMDTEAFLQK